MSQPTYLMNLRVTLSQDGAKGASRLVASEAQLESLGAELALTMGGGRALVMPSSLGVGGQGEVRVQARVAGVQEEDSSVASVEMAEALADTAEGSEEAEKAREAKHRLYVVVAGCLEELSVCARRALKAALLSDGEMSPIHVALRLDACAESPSEEAEIVEEVAFELGLARTTSKLKRRFARALALSATSLMGGMMAACGAVTPSTTAATPDDDHTEVVTQLDETGQAPVSNFDSQMVGIYYSFQSDAAASGMTPHPAVALRAIRFVGSFPPGAQAVGDAPLAMCIGYTAAKGDGTVVRWREIQVLQPSLAASYEDFDLHWLVYHELGHCLLEKGNSPTDKEGVMAPSIFFWQSHDATEWTGMVQKFFSPAYQAALPNLNGTEIRMPTPATPQGQP